MSFPQGTTATLEGEYRDGSGSFADPTSPLVSILNPLGGLVVTDAVPTRASLGHYSYDYAIAEDATLGTWIARWKGTLGGILQTADDEFEVTAGAVADPYVSIDEIRALKNLDDTAKFTDAELRAARSWFEAKFENHVGMAFVPRTATDRLNGTGSTTLRLNHWPVRSVTAVRVFSTSTTSTAYTADELADITEDAPGYLRRWSLGTFAAGLQNIEVDYTHGQESTPEDIKDAALVAIREKLLKDHSGDRGNRHLGVAQEGVFVRNTKGPFFNDEVNDVADAYRAMYRIPAMA